MQQDDLTEKFLNLCLEYYKQNILPVRNGQLSLTKSNSLIEVTRQFFSLGNYNEFIWLFRESQYLVNLWAAHLLIEFGNPTEKDRLSSLKIISRYSKTPLNPELAEEETKWLNNYTSEPDRADLT